MEFRTHITTLLAVFLTVGLSVTGCTSAFGGRPVRKAIRDIREKNVNYVQISDISDTIKISQDHRVVVRVVVSSLNCSSCFDEIIKIINTYSDETSDVKLSLVIANPDTKAALQLKRMHRIQIPVFVSDDDRLRSIGSRFGTAFVFLSSSDLNIYMLRPLRSTHELAKYLGKRLEGGVLL